MPTKTDIADMAFNVASGALGFIKNHPKGVGLSVFGLDLVTGAHVASAVGSGLITGIFNIGRSLAGTASAQAAAIDPVSAGLWTVLALATFSLTEQLIDRTAVRIGVSALSAFVLEHPLHKFAVNLYNRAAAIAANPASLSPEQWLGFAATVAVTYGAAQTLPQRSNRAISAVTGLAAGVYGFPYAVQLGHFLIGKADQFVRPML